MYVALTTMMLDVMHEAYAMLTPVGDVPSTYGHHGDVSPSQTPLKPASASTMNSDPVTPLGSTCAM
jgi:hypothetical protein